MNLEKKVTTHVEGPVNQQVHWDPKSKKIEVVHYFNLKPGKDVILSRIEKFVITDKQDRIPLTEISIVKNRKKRRNIDSYGTRFIYLMVKSELKEPHAVKFPDRGTCFPLSNIPHHIEVIVE
jgi:hypothetical protein